MSETNKQQPQAGQNSVESIESLKAAMEKLRAESDAKVAQAKKEAEAAKAEARAAAEEKARIEEELRVQSEAIDAEVTRQEAAIQTQLRAQRKVRITIAGGKSPHERCPVTVAVNGHEYLIVRDKEVDVPQGVLNVLDLAQEQVPGNMEENGQNRTVFQPAQRFAYRVLGHVDPATGELER